MPRSDRGREREVSLANPWETLRIQPNAQQITASTLPLLATVLAGFSTTIVSQFVGPVNDRLFGQKDAFWMRWESLSLDSGSVVAVLGLLLLSTSVPMFLAGALCATWGQAYAVTEMTEDVQSVLKVKLNEQDLRRLYRRWRLWDAAARQWLYLGALCFLVGNAALLSSYLGVYVGLTAMAASLTCGFFVRLKAREDSAIGKE